MTCETTKSTALRMRLVELLSYDALTGVFTRRVDRSNRKAGETAGSLHPDGYLQVAIDGRRYLCHRLAWLYEKCVWPEHEIDHINGDRADNRIANLRDVTKAVNQQNLKDAPRGKNSDAPLGVTKYSRRAGVWRAQICVDGKQFHIGYFLSQEAAHAAYINAKRRLHEGNTL